MPTARSFFHKNRSQGSLLSTQESAGRQSHQASPIDSPLHSPRLQSSALSPDLRNVEDSSSIGQSSVYRPDEGRYYYQASNIPARSQSQRSPPPDSSYDQPTINLVGPSAGSAGTPAIDENPDIYYTQPLPQAAPKEDSKRRRFFKLGSAKDTPTNPAPTARLGRSISVRKRDLEVSGDVGVHVSNQHRRPSKATSVVSPQATIDQETEEVPQSEASARRPQSSLVGPPLPEKDSLRSFKSPLPAQLEQAYNNLPLQGVNTNLPQRQPYERQGSAVSSLWESPARSLQHPRAPSENLQQNSSYQASPSSANSNQTPQSYQASPSSATSTSSHPLQPRGQQEAIQQYRYEFQRERPASQQSSQEPPSPIHPAHRGFDSYHERQGSNRSSLNAYTPNVMGPPPPPPQQQSRGRHSDEMEQRTQPGPLPREGSGYQPYQQAQQGQGQANNGQGQYGPQLGVSQQAQTYRGTPQPSPLPAQTLNESGRNTPPPSRSRDDLAGLDVAQLLARHDELRKLIAPLC